MSVNYFPGHYLGLGDYSGTRGLWTGRLLSGPKDSLLRTRVSGAGSAYKYIPFLTGVLVRVSWGYLETAEGVYNTKLITDALEEAEALNLKLAIHLQDRRWGPSGGLMPEYLESSAYGQTGSQGAGKAFGKGGFYVDPSLNSSLVPRHWNKALSDRFVALIEAIAGVTNNSAAFAGLHLSELHTTRAHLDTSNVGLVGTTSREEAFITNRKNIYQKATTFFSNNVVYQMANWSPKLTDSGRFTEAQLKDLFEYGFLVGVGLSGPDALEAHESACGDFRLASGNIAWREAKNAEDAISDTGYFYPRAIQCQSPSTGVSTSFFGRPGAAYNKLGDTGARALAAGAAARSVAASPDSTAVLLANPGEGHLYFSADELKCGTIIWTAKVDVTNLTERKPCFRYWNDIGAMETLRRVGQSDQAVDNKPPVYAAMPKSIVNRDGGGTPEPGDYETPKDFVVSADELTWAHSGVDLKHFILLVGGKRIKLGKAVRAIDISATGVEPDQEVTLQAFNRTGGRSAVASLKFEPSDLDPPSEVCVDATTISWTKSETTKATGFNVYLHGGAYANALIAARGPAGALAPLPSGLASGTYTASVRTVTAVGLSAARSKEFVHPLAAQSCSEEPTNPDCDDPTTKTTTCAVPRVIVTSTGTTLDDTAIRRHNTIAAELNRKQYDVVFLGDSITRGWTLTENKPQANDRTYDYPVGKSQWDLDDSGLLLAAHAFNGGHNGDRIQHLLYRVKGGLATSPTVWTFDDAKRYFAARKHKIAVLMIGTNNLSNDRFLTDPSGDGPGIANAVAGIKAIVNEIRDQSAQTKVLILEILPREKDPADRRLIGINAALIAEYGTGATDVRVLRMRDLFATNPSAASQRTAFYGTGTNKVDDDLIHINVAGYALIRTAILPVLKGWLGIS